MSKKMILGFAILFSLTLTGQNQLTNFPALRGPYLGQKPPGMTPELFAPEVISRPNYFEHSAAIFTPDGREVYWTAKPNDQRDYRIFYMKMVDGIWSRPEVAVFCEENMYYQECILSSDGKKLYFTDGSNWQFVEKKKDEWSSKSLVSQKITDGSDINICSVTNSGSVYYIKRPEFDVYVTRSANGGYTASEKLSNPINLPDTRENRVYVSLDENFMVKEATKDGATCEFLVSFRLSDKSWSARKKLPIKWGRLPHISPDGKYLFFMTREGIYWVYEQIIDELKPKVF